jgi:hypothetical protein
LTDPLFPANNDGESIHPIESLANLKIFFKKGLTSDFGSDILSVISI